MRPPLSSRPEPGLGTDADPSPDRHADKERLFKQFQKHPDNPFNQVSVAYNATQEDKVAAHKALLAERERAMRMD